MAPPASETNTGSRTLSEHASKALLREFGLPMARDALVGDAAAAAVAAVEIGFPVALKLCGDAIAHKSERGLVRLGIADEAAVASAAGELLAAARPEDGDVGILVAEMVTGQRELIAGLVRDAQFGPCVLLGLGGVLTEALGDVTFAPAPLSHADARRMIEQLATSRLFMQPFRGEAAVDGEALSQILVALAKIGLERRDVKSVDLNPLVVRDGRPIAVDALVELGDPSDASAPTPPGAADLPSDEQVRERFRPLFAPRGVMVAGVSSHPGKFGFATLHNLIRFGFKGELFGLKPDGARVLDRAMLREVAELPEGAVDLVFVCTPTSANVELLRACAAKGVRAAFVASGGYAEAGEEGLALQRELLETARELDMLLVGPNGQGVISTPESMCAQIVAPYPPPGRIGVASQSGNLVSSFLNYAVQTGVGVSKAVSLGNSAQVEMGDLLEYFAVDPDTDVALVYVEGVGDGERFQRAVARLTARKPLVLVKGGVAGAGRRAAASHTGALASDDRIFDGVCRKLGVLRAPSIEVAFEWAASLVTQPLPRGRRTLVFTTAGGWGVLAADACEAAGLELIALPEELRVQIDRRVPARWSRNNPVDLAGGETRDTVPELLDLICAHPEVDAVIHLGIGIQSAQANVFRSGEFHPDHGLDRIVSYHERQDRRYAEAAAEASERHGVPVLTTSELVYCDSDYGNAGPLGVKEAGRLCYPSAHRAVAALRALTDWADYRRRP